MSTSDTLSPTSPLSSIREEASEEVSPGTLAEVVALLRARYESGQDGKQTQCQDQISTVTDLFSPEALASRFRALASLSEDNENLGSVSSVSSVSSASGADVQTLAREKKKAKSKGKNKAEDNENMAAQQSEDRKDQLFFSSWGQPQARSTPRKSTFLQHHLLITSLTPSLSGSQPRTVILSNIPGGHPSVNFTTIQSLVFGGSLECIRYKPNIDSRAHVTFTSGAAAKSYYDNTANGVVYNQPSLNLRFTAMVDLSRDNEPVSSRLAGQLAVGATRVIVIKNCPTDYTLMALKNIAQNKGRIVETIFDVHALTTTATGSNNIIPNATNKGKENETTQGEVTTTNITATASNNIVTTNTVNKGKGKEIPRREVRIRFTAIDFASTFYATIRRDEDFMESDILYGADPCAEAGNVHYD